MLSHKFWEDLVSTANYIHNELSYKGNIDNISHKILYYDKVDYNKFKIFGCLTYFYVPKQFREKSFRIYLCQL